MKALLAADAPLALPIAHQAAEKANDVFTAPGLSLVLEPGHCSRLLLDTFLNLSDRKRLH